MTKAFNVLILVSLAGCAGGVPSPTDVRNQTDRTLPPGEGAFGSALTWEWRKKDEPPPASSTPAPAPAAAPAAQAGAATSPGSSAERQEFEEWRAWQEFKRKNAK